jgi:hypothetical protein
MRESSTSAAGNAARALTVLSKMRRAFKVADAITEIKGAIGDVVIAINDG